MLKNMPVADRLIDTPRRVRRMEILMANIEQLKEKNIQHVRSLFYKTDTPWTRPDLAKSSSLSMGGIANILQMLIEKGEVRHVGEAPSTGGRKSKLYGLNPDFAHIGTILLQHQDNIFSIIAISTNLTGTVVYRHQENIDSTEGFSTLFNTALELLTSDPHLKCLVISFPGIVSPDGTTLSSDFPGFAGSRLKEKIEELLFIPVRIENDVNLAAIGYGQAYPKCRNLAVLYQPKHDPAGVGLLINGALYQGLNGLAGEIGRIEKDKQLDMLASDPERLLHMQIEALTSIVAPERIAWYCPGLKGTDDFKDQKDTDDFKDQKENQDEQNKTPQIVAPVIEHIEDLESFIRTGAEVLGKKMLLDMGSTDES